MKTSLISTSLARRRLSHTERLLILLLLAGGVAIRAATTLAYSNAAATVAPTGASQPTLAPGTAAVKVISSPPQPSQSILAKLGESLVPGDFKDWVALLGVGLAFLSYHWTSEQWKRNFLTEKWTDLIEFLQQKPQYMNAERNREYLTAFTADEAKAYEMVARLCIGYLDDMYFLGYRKHFPTWFRGSIKLFAGTHRSWLERNGDSYDTQFYQFLLQQLGSEFTVPRSPAKDADHG